MLTFEDLTEKDIERFWSGVDVNETKDDCWLWSKGKYPRGYGKFGVRHRKIQSMFLAHRTAYFLANGPFDYSLLVRHTCDVTSCCRPSHLELGTSQDNTDDMMKRGRHKVVSLRGEDNPVAKLDTRDAQSIFGLYYTYVDEIPHIRSILMKLYGVSLTPINRIIRREGWVDATKDLSPDTFRNVDFLEI